MPNHVLLNFAQESKKAWESIQANKVHIFLAGCRWKLMMMNIRYKGHGASPKEEGREFQSLA